MKTISTRASEIRVFLNNFDKENGTTLCEVFMSKLDSMQGDEDPVSIKVQTATRINFIMELHVLINRPMIDTELQTMLSKDVSTMMNLTITNLVLNQIRVKCQTELFMDYLSKKMGEPITIANTREFINNEKFITLMRNTYKNIMEEYNDEK